MKIIIICFLKKRLYFLYKVKDKYKYYIYIKKNIIFFLIFYYKISKVITLDKLLKY